MVGTELTTLLKWFGITYKPGCPCKDYAAMLDKMGIQWASANVATIIGWLRAEARRRKLPFSETAAGLLVRLAIRNAKKRRS